MREIKNLEEWNELLKSEHKLIVADFHAQWCGPCKMIAPKVLKMAEEMTNVLFCKVDVDEAEDVSEQEHISSMPTFLIFYGGKRVGEVIGASEAKLRAEIDKCKEEIKNK